MVLALTALAFAADVDTFNVAGSLSTGTGTLQGEAAHIRSEGPSAAIWGGGFHKPFMYTSPAGARQAGLSTGVGMGVQGSWSFKDRARVDLMLPFYPSVEVPLLGSQGPALGDIQLASTIFLAGLGDGFGFSLRPRIGLPSGTGNAFVGRGIHGGLSAIIGGDIGVFGWTVNTGLTFAPNRAVIDVDLGSTVDVIGGAWVRPVPAVRIGAELASGIGFLGRADQQNANQLNSHGFAAFDLPAGFGLIAGAGAGLLQEVGNPAWRVFGMLSWRFVRSDRDGDGIPDKQDACPDDPEDFDGFEDADGCPDPDNDGDGIPDKQDACPDDPEDFDGFEDADGCPDPDNDGDGIPDVEDRCPDEAGLADFAGCPDTDADGIPDVEDLCPDHAGPAELDGCPDSDGDGVPDYRDACPDAPGPAGEDPKTSDGCPKRVYVTESKVEITEKVFFDHGMSTIAKQSFPLLDDVASVFNANPQVLSVEVGGHTDPTGTEEKNLRLSQRRAEAVRAYLIDAGVEASRVTAKGYGSSQPIDTNRTEEGRSKNRRVEFVIVERAPKD